LSAGAEYTVSAEKPRTRRLCCTPGGVSSAVVKGKLLLPVALMVVFGLSRIPGMLPENFSAAYALAFCGGLYFGRFMAWWLPLGVLLGTDILLNIFYYHQPILDGYMLLKTLAFIGIIGLGRLFKPRMSAWRLIGGGLLGAVLFYLVTNTAAWLHDPGYPKTLAGLWQALTTGLPGYPPTWTFFRNTLMSGGLFTALFVGSMKLNEAAESKAEQEMPEEADDAEDAPTPENASA
jgi:hypothetical protein